MLWLQQTASTAAIVTLLGLIVTFAGKSRIDRLETTMLQGFADVRREMDIRFAHVDTRFDEVDKRFEQVDRRFEQVDKRFERMDQRLDGMDRKIESLRSDLTSVALRLGDEPRPRAR